MEAMKAAELFKIKRDYKQDISFVIMMGWTLCKI